MAKDIIHRIACIRVNDLLNTAKVISEVLELSGEHRVVLTKYPYTVYARLDLKDLLEVEISKAGERGKQSLIDVSLWLVDDIRLATTALNLLVQHHPTLSALLVKRPTCKRRLHRAWRKAAVDFVRGAEIAQQTALIPRSALTEDQITECYNLMKPT